MVMIYFAGLYCTLAHIRRKLYFGLDSSPSSPACSWYILNIHRIHCIAYRFATSSIRIDFVDREIRIDTRVVKVFSCSASVARCLDIKTWRRSAGRLRRRLLLHFGLVGCTLARFSPSSEASVARAKGWKIFFTYTFAWSNFNYSNKLFTVK